MTMKKIIRVLLLRKYLILIGCDYTSYYHHLPPVRLFPNDTANQKPLSSPWKHELLSQLQSVFKRGPVSVTAEWMRPKYKKHSLRQLCPSRRPHHSSKPVPGFILCCLIFNYQVHLQQKQNALRFSIGRL